MTVGDMHVPTINGEYSYGYDGYDYNYPNYPGYQINYTRNPDLENAVFLEHNEEMGEGRYSTPPDSRYGTPDQQYSTVEDRYTASPNQSYSDGESRHSDSIWAQQYAHNPCKYFFVVQIIGSKKCAKYLNFRKKICVKS